MGVAMDDRSALVPTEDTIEALVDHLVFPLLPIRESLGEVPSDHQQMMVAKQMHAVTILYNYYHRKQFPELEVLGFESLCKLCCIAKPGLLMYLRYMNGCDDDCENPNSQLSITEKMVKEACNICIGLDSSIDNPIMDGWPISKVAVFLVDSTEEKCLLQFCSVTQGVWSLVEKVFEAWHENGSSQNESYKSEEMLEQLAFSSVVQETGISQADLSILERHLTYSLSHEKTSTRLYIMTYRRTSNEELTEVAIKDVIRSLEGPLVQKDPTCEVTPVVEYYNMLPYIEIISSWLSRRTTDRDSLDMPVQTVNVERCSLDLDKIHTMDDLDVKIKLASNESKVQIQNSKPSKSETIEMNINDLASVNGSSGATRRPENRDGCPCVVPNRLSVMQHQAMNDKTLLDEQDIYVLNIKKDKLKDVITYNRRLGSSSRVTSLCKIVNPKYPLVPDIIPTAKDHVVGKTLYSSEQNLNVNRNEMVKTKSETIEAINDLHANNGSFNAFYRSQNTTDISQVESDDPINVKEEEIKDKSFHNGQSENITVSKKKVEDAILNNKESGVPCKKDALTSIGDALPSNNFEQHSYSEDISGTNIIPDDYVEKENNSIHNAIPGTGGEFGDQAGIVGSVRCIPKCLVEDKTSSSGANQDGCAGVSPPLVFTSNEHCSFYQAMASERRNLLQASLQVFKNKRDELCLQKRLLEDEIARCEMSIQRIFRGEGENPGTEVESIIEALNDFCSSPVRACVDLCEEQSPYQTIKRRKLSEAVLSLATPCQELDDICHKNSWLLPIYKVLPSFLDCKTTEMFKATVTINGTDFGCKSSGDLKSSPREARESAADRMLSMLRMWKAEQ